MAPNANPFNISGGGTQNLVNAQYIATTFSLAGGANLKMTVDPANAARCRLGASHDGPLSAGRRSGPPGQVRGADHPALLPSSAARTSSSGR